MKRSTWVALIFLGGGLGLVAHLFFGELFPKIHKDGTLISAQVKTLTEHHAAVKQKSDTLFETYPDLTSLPSAESDRMVINNGAMVLQTLQEQRSRLDTYLARNEASDNQATFDLIKNIRGTIQARHALLPKSKAEALGLQKQVTALIKDDPANSALERIEAQSKWFSDFDKSLKAALELRKTGLAATDLSAFQVTGDALVKAYPAQIKLAGRVNQRLNQMRELNTRIEQMGNTLEKTSQTSPPKKVLAARIGAEMTASSLLLKSYRDQWIKDVALVKIDQDKILIDMKTARASYAHKYRMIANGKSTDTKWIQVTKQVYDQHRDHLGMTIYSKPEGVFPEDATDTAAPPGYNYVGNPRYGRWQERNGNSFWVFYGRYALMRDLFWGVGSYRPIYRSEYRSYRRSRSVRRAYFGSKKQYGTAKAIKKKRYKNSSFATSKRKSSGYSGSKYSGSRRSGGYRSSRYRGSSFGGGGK